VPLLIMMSPTEFRGSKIPTSWRRKNFRKWSSPKWGKLVESLYLLQSMILLTAIIYLGYNDAYIGIIDKYHQGRIEM